MMELGELPAGWEKAELSEICLVNPTIDKSAIADDLAVSFVSMPAVEGENGMIDVSSTRKFGEVKKGYTPFREGDVLFAKITPCMENGKMAVVPALHNGLGFGSTEFHVLRAHPGISSQFVYYFVSSRAFRHVAEHNMSGAVGQRRVTTPYLSACKIPVPPTAEQHRIVAKIEELFSELDQGVASLKAAREQLKVYRQSLLKNAFEGKLTAAWRAAHRDQLETAAALQQRIAREREARYQQQLADWQTAGQSGLKPKAPKPLPPLTAEELAGLPELPEGWGWACLASVASVLSGYAFKSTDFETEGIPVVKIANVGYSQFIFKDQEYLAPSFLTTYGSFSIRAGDFLIALTRPITNNQTKVCRYPADAEPALLNQRVAALKDVDVDEEYFFAFLNTLIFKEFIRSKFSETLQPNLSPKDLEIAPFPVCSLTEQQQVVQELESKLSEADQLDQALATALQQADVLRQSILKKAFCGQLVKQDKNEEPATALLERIRAVRTASPARGRQAKLGSKPLPNC